MDTKNSEPNSDNASVQRMRQRLGQDGYERLRNEMRRIVSDLRARHVDWTSRLTRPLTPTDTELRQLDEEVERLRARNELKRDHRKKGKNSENLGKNDKNCNNIGNDDSNFEGMKANLVGIKAPKRMLSRLVGSIFICASSLRLHPQSKSYILWMGIQSLCFLYNLWAIPLRVCFQIYQNNDNYHYWLLTDYVIDAIMLFDLVFIKTRIPFLDEKGVYVEEKKLIWSHYRLQINFYKDILSILPTDLLYFFTGINGRATLIRCNRLLRSYHFQIFFDRLDAALPYPVAVRLTRTLNLMLFLIHFTCCLYYAFSDISGIGSSRYVFSGHGNAYIRCFHIALKTSVSIGINPKPSWDKPIEMLVMGTMWLAGVFIFAVLIGNVKDIIAQSTRNQDEYLQRFDEINQYMYEMDLPKYSRDRVHRWCDYTWTTQKTFDEHAVLQHLPIKMRTDVTLDVHYETLQKVQLFHGCDPGMLKQLVVALRPIIFLDGDYVCRKGDVGKEMFIITVGHVQVVGGENDEIVFVTLNAGVCFGEIALLASEGMNRRTANVRALGFTTLYVLYKEDLQRALLDYPEDRRLLSRKALKAAKEVAKKKGNGGK